MPVLTSGSFWQVAIMAVIDGGEHTLLLDEAFSAGRVLVCAVLDASAFVADRAMHLCACSRRADEYNPFKRCDWTHSSRQNARLLLLRFPTNRDTRACRAAAV